MSFIYLWRRVRDFGQPHGFRSLRFLSSRARLRLASDAHQSNAIALLRYFRIPISSLNKNNRAKARLFLFGGE